MDSRGFSLIEVLVTIVLLTLGMLGLAALQARTAIAELEAYQRTQALALAQDMADRLAGNKANAAGYVGDDYGSSPNAACGPGAGLSFDRCVWNNALRGAAEQLAGRNVGTLLNGRGCVTQRDAQSYWIVVSWQGLSPTLAPTLECGATLYGSEAMRRTVALPIRLADLSGT